MLLISHVINSWFDTYFDIYRAFYNADGDFLIGKSLLIRVFLLNSKTEYFSCVAV